MSLLIKALDKAQAQKAQAKEASAGNKAAKPKMGKSVKPKSGNSTEALSLEAVEENTSKKALDASTARKKQVDDIPETLKGSATESAKKPIEVITPDVKEKVEQPVAAQAQAANVFTAKQANLPKRTATLALLIGLIALGLMGALAYWYQTVFNGPDIVIPPRPSITQEMPAPMPELDAEEASVALEAQEIVDVEVTENEVLANEAAAIDDIAEPDEIVAVSKEVVEQSSESVVFQKTMQPSSAQVESAVEQTLTVNETVIDTSTMASDSNLDEVGADLGMASDSASIKMTRQQTTPGVNPVLMRAYEAYKAGNDNQAQQDYMQVLKRYGPNVDAMLGLGAIATRQNRLADANGWYRKVLEVEPRNETAKSGILNLRQGQAGRPANESNIKSMIATAPNDANLHASLGDLYAKKQQWSAAQQAYFDAYRFNPSAENAFNLGVSLDQLGKSTLALPYYREALQKSAQSNAIDAEALKARIASIE